MKVLILGGNGMLGHKLVQQLSYRFEVWSTLRGTLRERAKSFNVDVRNTFEKIDVGNISEVEKLVLNLGPDVIINAVGIIKQVPEAGNIINVLTVNSIFPHRLAEISEKAGSRLICFSTDCVFSGTKGNYTEDDIPDALDLYGKSKNLGEVTRGNSLTIRTSIIGREIETKHSLVEWFLSRKGKSVEGYKNAIFSGFPTLILADIIEEILVRHRDLKGLYHISSAPINKYELLVLLKKAYQIPVAIEPFEDFFVDRSLDSTKFRNETGFIPMSWENMLEKMAKDPTPYDRWKN